MTTFQEASQTRVALKMKLSQYSWYNGSAVCSSASENYYIGISVSKIDNKVKKVVPNRINGVNIKLLIDSNA